MFEIEYEFREKDLVHFNEMRLLDDEELQKSIHRNRMMLPGAMLMIGLFYYFYYGDMMTTIYIVLMSVAWFFVSPYVMKMDMRRQFLEKYTEKEKAELFGLHSLKIEQEYLAEKSPSGKHKSYWKNMVRIEFSEEYLYIYLELNAAIIIPLETIKKGDVDKFAEQADSMIERLS